MITCNRAHQPTEYEPYRFCIEASDLRIAPDQWPTMIYTDMGNGQPFVHARSDGHGGEVYRQQFGCIELHVVND